MSADYVLHLVFWSEDNVEAARQREAHADPLLDTLVHFTPDVVWEIAVEDGDYEVTTCVGDPSFPSPGYYLWVEGVAVREGVALEANVFDKVTQRVRVEDGGLTLTSSGSGSNVAKINYLEFRKL